MSVRQLSEHIRVMRTHYGLTQERLAELSGISRAYMGKIESQGRNLNWKTVEKISFAFGMTPSEFFNATDAFDMAEEEEVAEDGTITYCAVKLEKLPPAEEQEQAE